MTEHRQPHIWTPLHDGRPFETYQDQPDTAERVRRQVQAIPWALPEKRLGQVAPSRAEFDSADMPLRDVVVGGDSALDAGVIANSDDLTGREFRGAAHFSTGRLAPTFGLAIGDVVGIGPEKQMIRVDARPHVALVQNVHSGGNGAVDGVPCGPVGSFLGAVHPIQISVASGDIGGEPQQASGVGLRNGALFQLAPKLRVVQGFVSHSLAPFQRLMVRAGTVLQARFWPAFSSKKYASAKGWQ